MLLLDDPARAFVPYPPAPVPHAEGGPLSGLTLAVKDLYDVAGYPTGGGSPHVLAMSGIKTRTAPAVRALLDAGAAFVGKAHTDELAFSLNGRNAHFGTPVNGGAPERIPGGSSSGSASAVSNGLADLALGSDTGGSVRGPASHCGLLGIRPSHGRISLEGCLPLSPSFDTVGWFARDGQAFIRAGEALLGPDPAPLPDRPRLLLAADVFGEIAAEVREALVPAVARAEALLGPAARISTGVDWDAAYWALRRLQGREAWESHGAMIARHRPPLGPGVADRFAYGREVTDDQLRDGEAVRARVTEEAAALLGADAVLLVPTMPDIAPRLDEDEASLDAYRQTAVRLLCFAGLARLPQVSVPLARRLGAPLGLSLIGPRGSDLSLVRLAARMMAA